MRRICCWLILALVAGLAPEARAETFAIAKDQVVVPLGQSRTLDFRTVPQAGTTVVLKVRSRINSKTVAGSWMVMRLEVNGQEVQAQKGRGATRLLNRPLFSPVAPDYSEVWYLTNQGWRSLYAPDFTSALNQNHYVGEPYTLLLDITDLTNPLAENRIRITNTSTADIRDFSGADAAIVIDSLEIETRPVPSPLMSTGGGKIQLNRGEPSVVPARYQGRLLPGGGFSVQSGKNVYRFSSAFSYPNAGFNRMAAGALDKTGQSNWRVSSDQKAARAVANSPHYRVVRQLKFGKTHVEVADTITNLSANQQLGMSVRHEMDLTGLKQPDVRIAGDLTQNNYYAPGNPSVHVVVPSGSIGIIAKDNVLRNQAWLYTNEAVEKKPAVAGLRSDSFRLAPKASYTMRWCVYPVAGPGYYDFINLVRNDWRANTPVKGGVWWLSSPDGILDAPVTATRESLKLNGLGYVMITGSWVDHKRDSKWLALGTGVFDEPMTDYRRRVSEATKKLHEASADVKVLGYYNVQRDSNAGFQDSWMTGPDGQQLSTDWSGTSNRSYSLVPTLENSFGKAALTTALRYLDDLGLDGIYWDEMTGSAPNAMPLTYNMSDGYTAILDQKTWTVKQNVGLTSLLSLPFRLKVIEEVRRKGGVLLGNGPIPTLEELHTGMPQMVEIQHNDEFPLQGDLESPYGFIALHESWDSFLRTFRFAKLPIGIIPALNPGKSWLSKYPHDIMPDLFPFTPIELHAGYMLGRERIIVTHSGNFGWHGQKSLSLTRHFDSTGKLTDKLFPINVNAREARTDVKLNEKEAAVLKRVPLRFEPRGTAAASLTVRRYEPQVISMDMEAAGGGALVVRNGPFVVQASGSLTVQLGGQAPRAVRVSNGEARVAIPAGFKGLVQLRNAGR